MNRDTARTMGEVVDALHRDSRRKITKARITKSPSDGSGRFVALVSTFGLPPDDQGDVIDRWAYERYIADAVARNRMPSVWWGHGYSDPQNAIGRITKMATTDEGLVVEGQLSLDNARALNVYEGMLRGAINEFSIGYIVLAEHKESSPQYGTYSVLTEVSLSEISVVYAGANRFTRLLDIKSNTASSNTTSTVTWTAEPWRADLENWNRRIDEAAGPSRRKVSPDEVDAFIREVREERVRAKLAEAEQAAWEERMRINTVLDPVPVRVDARMRPVAS